MQKTQCQSNNLNWIVGTKILFSTIAIDAMAGIVEGVTVVVNRPGLYTTLAFLSVVIPILNAIVTIGLAVILIEGSVREIRPTSAAWVSGPKQKIGLGLITGIAVGGLWYVLLRALPFSRTIHDLSPILQARLGAGSFEMLFVLVSITVAPFSEELLYRGVLYGGYNESFGGAWATVLTTGLFVLGHLSLVIHHPHVILGLTGLSLAALWCRLRWHAIGPAIAAHIGYNLVFSFSTFARHL